MKIFWKFKKYRDVLMGLFIILIPFICLIGIISIIFLFIKYQKFELFLLLCLIINICGLYFFSYLFLDTIFPKFIQNNKDLLDKLGSICCWIGFWLSIGFLFCGYINIVIIYYNTLSELIYGLIVLTIITISLYLLKNKILQYSTAKSLIIYRITLVLSITVTSLLYTGLSIYTYCQDANDYNLCSLLTAFLTLWVTYLEFYHGFAYFNYKRSKYLLFLRNFSMDESIKEAELILELYSGCNSYRLFFMRIGNPRKLFDYSSGKTLYLNTINWKDSVTKYIKDSELVYAVVAHSDGLFWEIFNHMKYSFKFVYNILDISQTRVDIKNGYYESIKRTKFGGFLYFVCCAYKGPFIWKNNFFSISFLFNNERLVISSDVSLIFKYLFDNKGTENHENISIIPIVYEENNTYIYYDGAKYLIDEKNEQN